MTAKKYDAVLNLTDQIRLASDRARSSSTVDIYPIDILSIFKGLGGTIYFKKEGEDGVGRYHSILKTTKPNEFEVLMLSPDAAKHMENRFLIARCLGYLFLHTDYVRGGDPETLKVDPTTMFSPPDVDVFAASILMPKDHFLEVSSKNMIGSKYNIEVISNYFQVPAERVRAYGIQLGTYRWRKDY